MKNNVPPQEVNSQPVILSGIGRVRKVILSFFQVILLFGFPQITDAGIQPFTSQPTLPITEINIVTWVYLEGAMIDPGGSQSYKLPMRTTLNDLHFLPGQSFNHFMTGDVHIPAGQSYAPAPWHYMGTEGDGYNSYGIPSPGTANYPSTVVDWVLVSIRSTPDGIPLCSIAALLHNDGHVEMVDGGFRCTGLDSEEYFLVIEHRNHLIVMSEHPVPVIDGTLTYDFRYTQSYLENPGYEGFGQKEILPGLPGVYAMFAGNGEQSHSSFSDTDINFDDRTFWGMMNGIKGKYCNGDYNMNGDCNLNDLITWEYNNAVFSTVPRD